MTRQRGHSSRNYHRSPLPALPALPDLSPGLATGLPHEHLAGGAVGAGFQLAVKGSLRKMTFSSLSQCDPT